MDHACPMGTPLLSIAAVDTSDEADLVQRARLRDVAAFEHLYRSHVGRIYAVCLRLTASASRAEEVTQTAFIRAWQKLPGFRGDSAFGSWLHRLAVNAVLMEFRSAQRRESRVLPVPDLSEREIAPNQPASPAAGLRLDLEQAIAALPPRARAVFVLFEIEGYSHAEIAGILELEVGTTKAQLHRARQLVKESLQ